MSLFIAILDDDPAERKQSERLLSRERDARIPSGEVIYFDTYGSEEALLPHCLKYDLILIDITGSTRDGMMAAMDLLNHGAEGQIVLASSKIDYEAKYGQDDRFLFLKKPLWQRDFSSLIELTKKRQAALPPKIELRGEKDTIYVKKSDILYARDCRYYTLIALSGDRSFHMGEKLSHLTALLDPVSFVFTDKYTVINLAHVASSKGNSFKMDDGAVIKFSIFSKPRISRVYKAYAKAKHSAS